MVSADSGPAALGSVADGTGLAEGLVRAGANPAVWGPHIDRNAAAAAHLAELGGDAPTARIQRAVDPESA